MNVEGENIWLTNRFYFYIFNFSYLLLKVVRETLNIQSIDASLIFQNVLTLTKVIADF